jgi:hypothetical protein
MIRGCIGFGLILLVIGSLSAQGVPYQVASSTLDGRFVVLAREVPGFGGYFFDAQGDLNVYLTDLSQEPAARAAVADVAKNRPATRDHRFKHPAAIVIRRGVYDFLELDGWHRLMRAAFALPGVQSLDTDEVANVIRVGVTEEEAVANVEALAQNLGVPLGALAVDVVPPIVQLTTLRDFVRPTVGGLEIDFNSSSCTLGDNVWYSNPNVGVPVGTAGFLTASHCSSVQGTTDSTVYSQGGQRIGRELWDPPYFVNPQGGCAVNHHCRYSDVTFVAYDSGVSWQLGAIARTLFSGSNQSGSIVIDPDNPPFQPHSDLFYPTAGMYLSKVGEASGWTTGPVVDTCYDYFSVGDTILLCQDSIQAYATSGDSGAPVFWQSSQGPAFAGIVHSRSGDKIFFSNTQRILNDFGSMTFN